MGLCARVGWRTGVAKSKPGLRNHTGVHAGVLHGVLNKNKLVVCFSLYYTNVLDEKRVHKVIWVGTCHSAHDSELPLDYRSKQYSIKFVPLWLIKTQARGRRGNVASRMLLQMYPRLLAKSFKPFGVFSTGKSALKYSEICCRSQLYSNEAVIEGLKAPPSPP